VSLERVLAVVGPTATGKSELGLALAERFGGEVVNADSMQLYRGMDVGTAKLTGEHQRGVRHHLLDIWEVTETASVAEYQRLARAAVEDILDRGRVPVLVGGSGLYVRAVLDDMRFPGTDQDLRAQLEADLADLGAPALHRRLVGLDPAAAQAILPSNGRRLVRALEVIALTGRPFTATLPAPRPMYAAVQIGLDRADLDSRIDRRVDLMWQAGLVEEVRGLVRHGLAEGRTASRALGYQQVLDLLAGNRTEQQARQDTKQATRRFARRQRSWFRRDDRLVWLDAADADMVDIAARTAGHRIDR
jgi:tRNA isopentenyltransferase (miaA)